MPSTGKTPILYALGSNGSGQLGIGHDQDVSIPRQVLFSPPDASPTSPIIRVAAGGNHTLLLAADGTLYRAGDASAGACGPSATSSAGAGAGVDPVTTSHVARRVASLGGDAPVQLAAATWEASVIVQRRQTRGDDDDADDAIVSTFGAGAKGELGLGQFIIRTPTISRVSTSSFPPAGVSVVDLAASMSHVVAVLSNGTAWGWGSGRKGQLGADAAKATADGVVHEPRRIEGVGFPVARAVCGREFTVLFGGPGPDEGGEVLVLGADKAGVRSSAPARVAGWRDVGASWGGVYVLRGDGTLLSWGKDDHGQLAPAGLPPLAKMAVGSEHVVALTEDGDVLSWGWGEHGNCGPQVENGDVKGRWNTIASKKYIPPGSDIVAIGAGCATSWVSLEMASEP